MESSITTLMQNLSISEDAMPTLQKIKSYISSSSSSSLKNVVLASHVVCLYQYLDTINNSMNMLAQGYSISFCKGLDIKVENLLSPVLPYSRNKRIMQQFALAKMRDQIEVVCYILKSLFPILDPVSVVTELSSAIQSSLNHPNPNVKLLALNQLNQVISTSGGRNAISESPEIIKMAVSLIGNEDLSVASAAVSFLSNSARLSPSVAFMLLTPIQDSNLQLLKTIMSQNDEVRYRVFELVCNIQSESQELLNLSTKSGIVDELIKDLYKDDALLKVSSCAMLAQMASTKHSLDYLDQRGVVSSMVELLKNAPQDPLSGLYIPGLVKFFGNLCLCNSPKRVLAMYPGYFGLLFNMLEDRDPNTQRIVIETIGVVGRSLDGKLLLSHQGTRCTVAVRRICSIVVSGMQEIRLHAMNTMCQLLDLDQVPEEDVERVTPVTLEWFQLLSDDPIGKVVELCKLPFPRLRCAAFHLLKAVARCSWGLEAMAELSYMSEYLLDRLTESDKECKEAKYDVVVALCESKRCASIFGNRNYLKFRQFVKEGPLYVAAQLNVAIEEAS